MAKGIRHWGLFHLVDSHATALTMSHEPVDDLWHRRLGSATVKKLGPFWFFFLLGPIRSIRLSLKDNSWDDHATTLLGAAL